MINLLSPHLTGSKFLILGFGREGQSTFRFIRKYFPKLPLAIADRDSGLVEKVGDMLKLPGLTLHLGEEYLDSLVNYGFIIKSPGVAIPPGIELKPGTIVTSQTLLMLKAFHARIIGVTGTKGKSTTATLIHHLLNTAGLKSVLVGNIGRPPFDCLDQAEAGTWIVFEMSSHQLEDSLLAPHIAVLLNLFPEHLDRYPSLESYYSAKMRILKGQLDGDIFIYNEDIPGIHDRMNKQKEHRLYHSYSVAGPVINGCYLTGNRIILCQNGRESVFTELTDDLPLKGNHNRMNIMAGILAARNAGADDAMIIKGLATFHGLEHRLEYVGEYDGILYYNDSIATIPEATIAAVMTLPGTDTLILGGYDRMLDYSALIRFLAGSNIRNLIFLGKAGKRICDGLKDQKVEGKRLLFADSMQDAVGFAKEFTGQGNICLLSPAAASYDSFQNFEERGSIFKKIARGF